ncbi:MAG TPA: dihydropteroate synthase [Acidobacteriota bacterium]|nr:dihydropteroate synthase [Acidobacteriota bacterium]
MTDLYSRKAYTLRAGNWTLNLGARTLVMGILNTTPDSFSDRGRYYDPLEAVDRAWQIAEEGADILDIGGESTRPGSEGITAEEELRRVMPVIESLAAGKKYPIPISVDTTKCEVAKAALECGAAIINDITSLQRSPEIGPEAARHGAALVLMHMRGEPGNMQKIPPSADILADIDAWALDAVARAQSAGVTRDRIVLDPGVGFGKTAAQNMQILKNLRRLAAAGSPILVGTSRKSFIGAIVKKPSKDLVLGTGASVAASIVFGAHIVRVHDVAAIREVADVTDAIMSA